MEKTKQTSGPIDALSPSRITDYFNVSRSTAKGQRDRTKQHLLSKTSLYLTPDSSPGSDFGSDLPKESDESSSVINTNPDPDVCCNTDTDNISGAAEPTACKSHVPNAPDCHSSLCKSNEELNPPPADKSEGQSPATENSNSVLAETRSAKGRNQNPSADLNESLTSPSVPRPKLRRGTKSNSKSDALVPTNGEPAKPKPGRRKKKEPAPIQKNVITDFFPVRRSGRITKSEIEKEKHHQLEQLVITKCENGLKVTDFEGKGRGVIATKEFQKGDFVVEYAGDLLDVATAKQREKDYAANPQIGCYMYFFSMGTKHYCIDATAESGRLGRLINHSREGNCCTKAIIVKDKPRLILVAGRDIKSGEELSYDYGDRSRAALEAHPWLKS